MGRRIYCGEDFVWKYAFGSQASEQSRIYNELGLGNLIESENFYGDYLTLTRPDIGKLKRYLKKVKFAKFKAQYYAIMEKNDNSMGKGWVTVGGEIDKAIENLTKGSDYYFYAMIEAFIEYMEAHPDKEEFEFQGEY